MFTYLYITFLALFYFILLLLSLSFHFPFTSLSQMANWAGVHLYANPFDPSPGNDAGLEAGSAHAVGASLLVVAFAAVIAIATAAEAY